MSKVFKHLVVGLDEELETKIAEVYPNFTDFRILRQSVDARRSSNPHFIYQVEVFGPNESPPNKTFTLPSISLPKNFAKPLIIGAGPAGLFAALRFAERGIPCVLIERGSDAIKRLKSINRFWRYGELSSDDNVCFGEGGAGLYSDGKLITRIKSPHISYVMNRLVKFGAPAEIEYLANPHVGSDRIRRVIPKIRDFLLENQCEIHFNTKFIDLITEGQHPNQQIKGIKTLQNNKHKTFHSSHVILATGHSAEDIFPTLQKHGVYMEGKSFAMGLRIEHPQNLINKLQYRSAWEHPKLGAANYKLAHHNKEEDIGVYSFCMCPGGYVISSTTEAETVVCNGMSNYHRNSPFANSAIVVSLDHKKLFSDDLFAGMNFRKELEQKAYQMAKDASDDKDQTIKALPAQKVQDFINQRSGSVRKGSSPSGAVATRLDQLFPEKFFHLFAKGLEEFNKKMPGFSLDQAQLYGIESRTSCPIRITRDKNSLQSLSHHGLYPTGEGAGYAGGITSAAVDGIRAAEAIIADFM